MADQMITDYTAKTDVNGNELLEVVDLREALAVAQNKKMTIDTLFSSIVTHDGAVVVYEGEVVYSI
ncbi:hypothetical protein KA005_06090 [bacterium]|nr:hypothetical protein [bacterium]